jgi:hypothetical protein
MNKKANILAGLALLAITATASASRLPHTGPAGPAPRRQPPSQCGFTTRCAPAPSPCQILPRQGGCRGYLPPTRGGGR